MIGVYKITAPDGKIYVGQSLNLRRRKSEHSRNDKYKNDILKASYHNFGYNGHVFEILEHCAKELLNERERFYQDKFDVCGGNGLNCMLTGTATKPQVLRQELKDKIKNTQKQNPRIPVNSVEVFNNQTGIFYSSVSEAARTIGMSRAQLSNMLNGLYPNHSAFVYSSVDESLEIKLDKYKSKSMSMKKIRMTKGKSINGKPVLDTLLGVYYDSIKEAASVYGIKHKTLHAKLSGQNKNNTALIYA